MITGEVFAEVEGIMRSRLRQHSLGDWWLAGESLMLMPLLALALKVTSFRRLLAILRTLSPMHQPALSPARVAEANLVRLRRARHAAGIVNAVADRGPYRANCLKRSLALWWLLRRRGIASEVRIGVRTGDSGFEAHAWIECDGVIINDRTALVRQFIPFAGDIINAYKFI